ncbi:solute carrier family 13 member 2-like [Ixodes scapularis]|uniref:solute carrier family 13 member 2-like n=1 Tax=Ixodes scapularis TaxID=6945 RepID=UPI001A9E9285|nr:solute carrier family 13 member 2-like [Ixodes scapularis]
MIDQFSNQEDLTLTDLVRHNLPRRFQTVGFYVRVFAMYVIPLVLAPLLRDRSPENHATFIVLYVLFLWLFQSIPPAIVSFLPLILAPTFLNSVTDSLLQNYTSETMVLYIAYALVVNGVEATNLHKRLILTSLLVFGGKSGFIIGGFVTTTILVSMWTNAVKTAAIVLPIAMEAIQHIQDNRLFHVFELRTRFLHKPLGIGTPIVEARYLIEGGIVIPDVIHILSEFFTVKKGLLIGICYSAVLGSMGSVVGCGGNLFVKAFMEQMYNYRTLTMSHWALSHMPLTALCAFLLWIVLSVCYSSDVVSSDHISKRAFEDVIYKRFAQLGAMTYTEVATLILLFIMALAIIATHYYAEYSETLGADNPLSENACVCITVIVMYALPHVGTEEAKSNRRCRVHNVEQAVKKISWAFVITMGAGICVAKLIVGYNLQKFFMHLLPHNLISSTFWLQVLVACVALVLAEINNSLNNIIIFAPIIAHMSDAVKVHPMYLVMPFTFCSYFGFVLASATPVCEYVADYGDLQEDEFLLPGIAMKIGCTLIVILAYNTWCWDNFSLRMPLAPLMRNGTASTFL